MTDAEKIINPQHFGSDTANIQIRIRIRINSKIRIGIPDHLRLRFWSWRRFALSKHSLVFCTVTILCVCSASASAFTLARLAYRSATHAGNSTALNTAYSQTDCRWAATRQLPCPRTRVPRSSARLGLDREFRAPSSWISNQPSSVRTVLID